MAIAGYEYRINGGTPVNVGNVLTYIITGLTFSTTYTIEVRSFDDAGYRSPWSDPVIATTSAPSPADLGTLALWCKVDTGLYQDSAKTTPATVAVDPIGAWADSSGNGIDRLQATSGKRPEVVEHNGHLAAYFDGGDDILAGATTVMLKPMTFFCLYRPDNFDTGSRITGNLNNGISIDVSLTTGLLRLNRMAFGEIGVASEPLVIGEFNRIIVTYGSVGEWAIHLNGELVGSGTNDIAVLANDPTMGSDPLQPLIGAVMEMGFYTSVLDSEAITALDAYLVSVRGDDTIESFSSGTGILLKDDFATLANWTGSGFTAEENPAFVAFEPSPVILAPTSSGTDERGIREPHWMFVDDIYYEWYGGTDLSNWQTHLATSTDMTSLTKFGPLAMGLDKTSTPADGTWAACDELYVEIRAGVWYLHRLHTPIVSSFLPSEPYTSDVWTSTDPPLDDNWTFVRNTFTVGVTGFDDAGAYFSSSVKVGATYYAFYGAKGNVNGEWDIGIATASAPDGPFTKLGKIIDDSIKGDPENPKVFWSATLNRFVMLVNQVDTDTGGTLYNSAFFSTSLTDWSACTRADFQLPHTAANSTSLDGVYALGIPTPIYGEEGAVLESPNGCVSFAYDCYPTGIDPLTISVIHFDRRIRFGGLEPSRYRMETDAFGDSFEMVSAVAHGDFVATFVIELEDSEASGAMWFGFRDEYKVYFEAGDNTVLQRNDVTVDGSGVNLFLESLHDQNFRHYRVRVIAQGQHIRVYFNGELQVDFADNGPTTGTEITFGAAGIKSSIRRFAMQDGNYFTLTGLVAAAEVVAYGPGGHAAMAWGTADEDGLLILQSEHYPIERLLINGTSSDVEIYGGDVVSA